MNATISCIDVGQGDCTVAVDEATGDGLLIDCRSGHHRAAVDELDLSGLKRLRAAIVSHSQMDHFGGVLDVLEALAERFTGRLYFNLDSLMAMPASGQDRKVAGRKLRALIQRALEYGDRVEKADTACSELNAGSITGELLAPTYQQLLDAVSKGDPNRASGIVLLKVGGQCVIVGGDAPLDSWEGVADRLPKGCIVRWPHHGGGIGPDTDAHRRLRDLLEPTAVVVSVGANNPYGHPSAAFFNAAGGQPGRLLCTQATASCLAAGKTPGRCAGTIRIYLTGSSPARIEPDTPNHSDLIASLGNAQCLVDQPAPLQGIGTDL